MTRCSLLRFIVYYRIIALSAVCVCMFVCMSELDTDVYTTAIHGHSFIIVPFLDNFAEILSNADIRFIISEH